MIVRTEDDKRKAITFVSQINLDKSAWEVKGEPLKLNRSIAQNAILNAWYTNIGKHTCEGFKHTRGYFKWTYGVPILLARGEVEFDQLIDAITNTMQYEQIIDLFGGKSIAVSSVMKVGEFTDYLTAIEQHCADKHIPLIKDDYYDMAMGVM